MSGRRPCVPGIAFPVSCISKFLISFFRDSSTLLRKYTHILNASVAVVVVFIVYGHVLYSTTLHMYYKARDSTRQYETVRW